MIVPEKVKPAMARLNGSFALILRHLLEQERKAGYLLWSQLSEQKIKA